MDKKLPKRSIETVKYTFFSHATNRQLEKKSTSLSIAYRLYLI